MSRVITVALTALLGSASASVAAPPTWLRQVAQSTTGSAAATVLLDDAEVTVTTGGKLQTLRRYAVKIGDRSARDAAAIREPYVTGSGRVRSIKGWIIKASGQTVDLGSEYTADVAMVNNDVYNEVRVRALAAGESIADGDVFGAEVESEDSVLFAQLEWQLQDHWPVLQARRVLKLPSGWRASSVTFNAPALEPRVEGSTWTWQAQNLVEIPREAGMPSLSSIAPRLAVNFYGPAGAAARGEFSSWGDVAQWLDAISTARAPAEDVARRARELTGATKGEFERVAAIGQFAQRIQYVSIQTGIGRGGGYQPRPASLVVERNYGDCKDKANLVREMMAAIGVKAYLVSIFSGDRTYVRNEWPTPQQFNHAIAAIAVSADVKGPAVIEHPVLGRLLLFDPTDSFTPVGELPRHQQGSLALIVDRSTKTLDKMPEAPEGHDATERTLKGSLDEGGRFSGTLEETFRGNDAAQALAIAGTLDEASHRALLQRRLTTLVPGARLSRVSQGAHTESGVARSIDFSAPQFAQRTGNLLIVKTPHGLGETDGGGVGRGRTLPFLLEPRAVREKVELQLPPGFQVDEVPEPVSLNTTFGTYSRKFSTVDGRLLAERTLHLTGRSVPAAESASLRTFMDAIRAADTAPVVLKSGKRP